MPLSLTLPIQVDAGVGVGVGVWTGVAAGKRQGVWGQWGLSNGWQTGETVMYHASGA